MGWPCGIAFGTDDGEGTRDAGWLPRGRRARLAWLAGALALAALLYAGWRLFWFLTDDAYIAFRYVSNAHLGFGYTWNPPPFRPVEGYTSLAWVALLDGIWRLLGVEPPHAANPVALLCAAGTLLLCWRLGTRLRLRGGAVPLRGPLVGLALLATVTNRTFLAWTSSGLETALFNLLAILWLVLVLGPVRRPRRWAAAVTGTAVLVYLTRPDGLLWVAGSAAAVLLGLRARCLRRGDLVGLLPALAVPAHLLWRRAHYGAWLPNTWHAKQGFWPESGLLYLFSFVLEYAVWIWLLLLLGVLATALRKRRRAAAGGGAGAGRVVLPGRLAVAVAVLAAHAGYYTLVLGGDHFEYRITSHLVPLLFLSGLWLADRLLQRPAAVAVVLGAWLLCSWPIPWLHWSGTHNLESRRLTYVLIHPVAQHFPPPLRWVVGRFDAAQARLIEHHVGMRHQEHKIFHETLLRLYPVREDGARLSAGIPVHLANSVGVAAWTMPHVAVLDGLGLNDYVIARNRPRSAAGDKRLMAHDREAPEGYVECFRPNVRLVSGTGVAVFERDAPLTAADVRSCEAHWWEWADARAGR